MAETKQEKEARTADLKAAQEAAPSEEQLRELATRVPPLPRDADHSFVTADDTELADADAKLVQPDLTNTSLRDLEQEYVGDEGRTLKITRPDRAKSTYERSSAVSETDLERLTDDQIKSSGILKKATPQVHPARIAPHSTQPRQPGANAPAAGAGSWPENESRMPAVMPSDPPLENADDRHLGDNTFAKQAGFSTNKDGTLKRKGLTIEKNEVAGAAALYLRLRQQFPAFTEEQLADEFELQWLSGRIGAEQSHRPGEEMSQQGLTEVGDDRVYVSDLGHQRATSDRAFEADPAAPPTTGTADTTLPSTNEPASRAVDEAKEPTGETDKADADAAAAFAKFDHDGDGRPGGAPPGGNKK